MLKSVPVWIIYHVVAYLPNAILSIVHKVLIYYRLTIETVSLNVSAFQWEKGWRFNNVLRDPGPVNIGCFPWVCVFQLWHFASGEIRLGKLSSCPAILFTLAGPFPVWPLYVPVLWQTVRILGMLSAHPPRPFQHLTYRFSRSDEWPHLQRGLSM
jgi:hypothetical protein